MPDFLNLKKQNLKYLDALTYASIRSFNNTDKGYAYPPYEKIMERSGLGRTFIAESIKRLELAGHLNITHSNREGTCNQYYFGNLKRFERIPYQLFEATDLSNYEKAMIICLRQFFVQGELQCSYDIKTFAKLLGISYKQVYSPLKSLIAKGYIGERNIYYASTDKSSTRLFYTGKINWKYEYRLNVKPEMQKRLLIIS